MRRILLSAEGREYKANLHAHSTLSDGCLTPEELKEAYKAHGYSVLAVTEHEVAVDHSALSDPDFIMLTAYELGIRDDASGKPRTECECCHLNLFAKDPHNVSQVWFDSRYQGIFEKQIPVSSLRFAGKRENRREYSVEGVNRIIRDANENGFLVCYNHPQWSLAGPSFYCGLRGLFAMEIYNNNASKDGINEFNSAAYDSMLRAGLRIGCVAADDCHGSDPIGHPHCDLFGGFTMLCADSLSYASVIAALETGEYYASCGPHFREIAWEDGAVRIRCSGVRSIAVSTNGRYARAVHAEKGGVLTEAVLPLLPEAAYFRVELTDREGYRADSRAYFRDEFLTE